MAPQKSSQAIKLAVLGSAALLVSFLAYGSCDTSTSTTQPSGYHGYHGFWGGGLARGSGAHGISARGGFGSTGHAVGG